jgi:hypothetical protein
MTRALIRDKTVRDVFEVKRLIPCASDLYRASDAGLRIQDMLDQARINRYRVNAIAFG